MKKNTLAILELTIIIFAVLFSVNYVFSVAVSAELLERVVAVVNDDVILLSEFEEAMKSADASGVPVSEEDVLNDMINRKLLLKEAVSFRLDTPGSKDTAVKDDDAIIKTSIDRRIRAFIHVPYDDIENYYMDNQDLFSGREFYDVRDEIEKTLIEDEMRVRLNEYIKTLRDKSYIRIQLKEDN